ncbi:MAG: hypothetical protein NZ602_06245 [Thermoguttaceae bacterium]|nr:hypothetical protein [Thermoguttaceae bacterium]MDW8039469.1 hypothetical protein [Thermoguttaceae bacterium]
MTSRERWTVYPLILLAVGIGVRDKFWPASLVRARSLAVDTLQVHQAAVAAKLMVPELKANHIQGTLLETTQLCLVASDGAMRASLLGELTNGGQIVLYNRQGKPVLVAGVEPSTQTGILEIVSLEGKPLVQLRSAAGHGVVNAVDRTGSTVCVLGSDGQTAGLFLELPRAQKVLPLRTVPIPPDAITPQKTPR